MPREYKKLDKTELLARYPTAETRLKMVQLLDIREFLLDGIIRSNYKIPDSLNQAIVTSEYGSDFVRGVTSKTDVSPKEARLICLLEFYHLELMVDVEQMDPKALVASVSEELLAGHILLPFTQGPQLYERAAELFPDERPVLPISDVERLLEGMPIGVFQCGHWVSGPFGLLRSKADRGISPTRRVPLQHCHDVTCTVVHPVVLQTDHAAKINEHRAAGSKYLEDQSDDPSEFGTFFAEITKDYPSLYDETNPGTLPLLVGDAFSDSELQILLAHLFDSTAGELRAAVAPLALKGHAEDVCAGLNRAQLLQLVLLTSDLELQNAIDHLVLSKAIDIPQGEIRSSVLWPEARAGAFGSLPEISRWGLRFATRTELAPLRLRRLIEHVCIKDARLPGNDGDRELDWALRDVVGESIDERLDEYLRSESPESILSRLIMPRIENVDAASSKLGLTFGLDLDDATRVNRMLWKLGFPVVEEQSYSFDFWRSASRLGNAVRSASVSTVVDEDSIREISATYFVNLERLLADSLGFSAWLLTTDHATQSKQFQYDSRVGSKAGFRFLNGYLSESTVAEEGEPLEGSLDPESAIYQERTTLGPLCEGFLNLAKGLEEAQSQAAKLARDPEALPDYFGVTELRRFPLLHRYLFLDLTPKSQARILELLRAVSKSLATAHAAEVRNEHLHYRRESSDLRKLSACLDDVSVAIRALDEAGLTRDLFQLQRREGDRWGRTNYYFTSTSGAQVTLSRPSEFAWINLPPLERPQYLVTVAQLAEPNEIVRITPVVDSEFERMWSNFPQRRRESGRAEASTVTD